MQTGKRGCIKPPTLQTSRVLNGPSLSVLLVELVGEAEVMQLPRVGREVEGVEVRPLAVPVC